MPSPSSLIQTCLVVSSASLSVLGFEITLVRLCSIRFSYHYASLIISLSMIGFVLGGVVAYVRRKPLLDLPLPDPFNPRTLAGPAAALSLSMPLVLLTSLFVPFDHHELLWQNRQIVHLGLLASAFTIPFFIYGTMMSLLFKARPALAGPIYGADLAGAAAGVLVALVLLDFRSPEQAIIMLSAFPALMLIHLLPKGKLVVPVFYLVLFAVYFLISQGLLPFPMSPYKGLTQALKEDGAVLKETIFTSQSRLDLFENPRMRFAPGLSLGYAKPVPKGLGIAIDGNITGVLLDEKSLKSYDFFLHMPAALPYLLTKPVRVTVLGGDNGLDVLMPYYFGARHVYGPEKNLSLHRLVHHLYGPDSLYAKALRYETARSALKREGAVDVVVISRMGFFPSGAFGLQEDYDTTVEALGACLSSLTERGILFVQLFILPPPRYEMRMMNNIAYALAKAGVKNPGSHLVVFRSWDTMNFLVRKSGFTADDREKISQFLEIREFSPVYPPAPGPAAIRGLDYTELFRRLLNEDAERGFQAGYPFDVRITTDDRPFFHYFLKLGRIGDVYRLAGSKWSYFVYEGMALPFLVVLLALASLTVFASALVYTVLRARSTSNEGRPATTENGRLRRRAAALAYFTLTGAGFMFVEVFFIHALILPFGSPVTSLAVTLIALLLSSGVGSFLSGRMRAEWIGRAMLAVPGLLVCCTLLLPALRGSVLLVVFAVLSGVCLGAYFPSGIRLLCDKGERIVPLAYAANGAASIIAPPLASVGAAGLGLSTILAASAAIYLMASLAFIRLARADASAPLPSSERTSPRRVH